jgi:hypothetical protein
MKSRNVNSRFHGCVPLRIVTTLWLHLRAEQLARENNRADMRRLLGDWYQEDTEEAAGATGGPSPTARGLIDCYSATTTLP